VDVYLDALREAGVPYSVERDRRYFQRREVVDASALLRAVLDPHDHLALVAWLRSPSVGVPDAAWIPLWAEGLPEHMSHLAAPGDRRAVDLARCIDRAAVAVDPTLPGIDRVSGWERSLRAAVETLAALRAAFASEPADRFVERLRTATLVEASEAARFLGHYRAANLDRFFREVRGHLEETGGDVTEVLRRVRRAVDRREEMEEARPREAADDAVRIMSIHKAKGLDFTHVYFVQTHHGQGGGAVAPARLGRGEAGLEYALFGVATPGFDRAEERARRIEAAEQVRTLYVAMTRARDRLVVSGRHPDGDPGWEPGRRVSRHAELLWTRREAADPAGRMAALAARSQDVFRDEAGVTWRFPGLTALVETPPRRAAGAPGVALPAHETVAAATRALGERRQRARTRRDRPVSRAASDLSHEAVREHAHDRRYGEDDAPPASAATRGGPGADAPEDRLSGPAHAPDAALAAAVGTAVHAVLERAAPVEDGGVPDEARGIVEATLATLLPPARRPAARDAALGVLDAFAATSLFAEWTALASHVLGREVPVLLPPDAEDERGAVGFVSGAVDLLYRDPASGEIVVADYKTDDVRAPGAVDERVRRYAGQGGAYVRAVQEALGLDAPPRFELWFLAAGRRVAVEAAAG
jgi:ATP-dependent exoDNAse (exonuclease V) beta subunit